MESNQDIARGFVKGDRVISETKWIQLTEKLNHSGPPTKDCNGWKKTWADWKVYIKKKMCHNKKENDKTGGGQFNKYVLSDIEETVARVSGLYRSVEGITGAKSFAEFDSSVYLLDSDKENEDEDMLDLTPSTSAYTKTHTTLTVSKEQGTSNPTIAKRRLNTTPSPDPKRFRPNTPCTPTKADLNNLLAEENKHLKNIVKILEEQRADVYLKKIVVLMEEQRDEMRLQNQRLDRLCNILERHSKASQLNDMETQRNLKEKNEMKLKLIEIETLRLQLDRQK